MGEVSFVRDAILKEIAPLKANATAKGVAGAINRALRAVCADPFGQKPDIETFIHTPEQSEKHINARLWHVCWEAGPYQWACGASWAINDALRAKGIKWYVEPQWSFSLVVCEA